MARVALADDELETMIGSTFPRDLELGGKDNPQQRDSLKRFETWIDGEKKLGTKLAESYSVVLAQKDATSSVAAALRIGQVSMTFWRALMLGEIPKAMRPNPQHDAYCGQLHDISDALRARSIDVFQTCLAKANELDAGQDWAAACWREGAVLDPLLFAPVRELRSAPSVIAAPIAVEPPVTSPPLP